MHHTTPEHITAHHSTPHHSTAQHNTAQHNTTQHPLLLLHLHLHPHLHLISTSISIAVSNPISVRHHTLHITPTVDQHATRRQQIDPSQHQCGRSYAPSHQSHVFHHHVERPPQFVASHLPPHPPHAPTQNPARFYRHQRPYLVLKQGSSRPRPALPPAQIGVKTQHPPRRQEHQHEPSSLPPRAQAIQWQHPAAHLLLIHAHQRCLRQLPQRRCHYTHHALALCPERHWQCHCSS